MKLVLIMARGSNFEVWTQTIKNEEITNIAQITKVGLKSRFLLGFMHEISNFVNFALFTSKLVKIRIFPDFTFFFFFQIPRVQNLPT